jgi:glycosyltransferase involved in cell wall biosynthesis
MNSAEKNQMHYLSKNDQPVLSLVVCTRNRAQFLPQHLAALKTIETDLPWEIVFVDNNSSDETPNLLKSFVASSHIPTIVVDEKIAGLGNARNAGWVKARAQIVAFTDDDCYPDANFVNTVVAAFEERNIEFVGGRVLLHDPKDLPMTIMLSEDADYFNAHGYIGPGHIHGANFAMTKRILETLGGFDSMMGSGTPFPCEDCDIFFRALNVGVRGKYCPEIIVSHHHRRQTSEDLAKIEKAYLAGRAAFYMKSIVDLPKPLRTARMWYHSIRYFGFSAFLKELVIGIRYLVQRRKLKN